MLSDLYFPFSLIGLTETKIKVDQFELPSHQFELQTLIYLDIPLFHSLVISMLVVLGFISPIIWISTSCQILQKVLMILKPCGLKYKILATPICSVV